MRKTIAALIALTIAAAALSVLFTTEAGASSIKVTDPVAITCFAGDPHLVVTGVGAYPAGQSTRIVCEAGSKLAGAVLRYSIEGAGVGWQTSTDPSIDGANLLLNTMGTKIHMDYQIINNHVFCPPVAETSKYGVTCTKSTWGYPNERAEDGL